MVAESFACKGQVAPSGGQVCNLGMFPWTILDEFSENFQTASDHLPLPPPSFWKTMMRFFATNFSDWSDPPPFPENSSFFPLKITAKTTTKFFESEMSPPPGSVWWSNLLLIQVAPSECKWRHQMAKFAANSSGAMLLPILAQVTESISESVVILS